MVPLFISEGMPCKICGEELERMTAMQLGNKLLKFFLSGTEGQMLKSVNYSLILIWSSNVGCVILWLKKLVNSGSCVPCYDYRTS
jgi:hypothetical protein